MIGDCWFLAGVRVRLGGKRKRLRPVGVSCLIGVVDRCVVLDTDVLPGGLGRVRDREVERFAEAIGVLSLSVRLGVASVVRSLTAGVIGAGVIGAG